MDDSYRLVNGIRTDVKDDNPAENVFNCAYIIKNLPTLERLRSIPKWETPPHQQAGRFLRIQSTLLNSTKDSLEDILTALLSGSPTISSIRRSNLGIGKDQVFSQIIL